MQHPLFHTFITALATNLSTAFNIQVRPQCVKHNNNINVQPLSNEMKGLTKSAVNWELSWLCQVMENKSCVVLATTPCYCTGPPLLAIQLSTQVNKVDVNSHTSKTFGWLGYFPLITSVFLSVMYLNVGKDFSLIFLRDKDMLRQRSSFWCGFDSALFGRFW